MQVIEFDTVVVGSGLAGLAAAYYSSFYGRVAIVTKSELDTSNSYYAQGGIAAALSGDDSPAYHLHDTLVAGRGLCNRQAAKILAYESCDRVSEVIEMGMEFDKVGGNINFGLEGGHSKRRVLHADGDATGRKLTCFMLAKATARKSVHPFEHTAAVKIIKQNNRVAGLQAFDFVTNKNILFKSKAVILATGGFSRIYARSTNPRTATGDGIALAYNAGAKIADIEFVQFHPSALSLPGKDAFLISEAVRGEGAWLINEKGERFMKDIHPLTELAPRDVVAYSIYRQIQKSKSKVVFLSLKHLDSKKIKKRFHNIYDKLLKYGFDLCNDELPIAPAAHYMVGGIKSGLDGETNITGLFVCGETASTGVMGANRLASNSLAECLVFGKRASETASQLKPIGFPLPPQEEIRVNKEDEAEYLKVKNEIAELMSGKAGIVRDKKGLETVVLHMEDLFKKYSGTPYEYSLVKTKNTALVALLIAKAALAREESRGAHIRDDFQKQFLDYRAHSIQQINKELVFEPV